MPRGFNSIGLPGSPVRPAASRAATAPSRRRCRSHPTTRLCGHLALANGHQQSANDVGGLVLIRHDASYPGRAEPSRGSGRPGRASWHRSPNRDAARCFLPRTSREPRTVGSAGADTATTRRRLATRYAAIVAYGRRVTNRLFYGDNLDVLRRHIPDESVDLVYLDPPFNSNRKYNVFFSKPGLGSNAQIQAFDDTWQWTAETARQYEELVQGGPPNTVSDALSAMHLLLGEDDLLAYLVNMAPRLVELHRVLKPTGSLYLHCDPTASHYLKVLLDATFGVVGFRNEIIWKRTPFSGSSKARALQFPRSHDVILFFTKGQGRTWHSPTSPYSEEYLQRFKWEDERGHYRKTLLKTYSPETLERLRDEGRLIEPTRPGAKYSYKQYLSESSGTVQIDDVWTDINSINPVAKERLGYPTQKPVALLERILGASSNPGDVVLDPFCGCGTTIDAAIRLNRRWIGVDITYIAVHLIENRLKDSFGDEIGATYEVVGIPRDFPGAQALFDASPFDFERWAVSLVDGTPNQKQVADKGMDGVIRFLNDSKGHSSGRILVSVKGGRSLNPGMVRDLAGTLEAQKADMGLLITLASPTRGMLDAANHAGYYTWPPNGQRFPRVQIITVADLLNFKRPKMPPPLRPYISAARQAARHDQLSLELP